jgi:hypothetical protein
MFLKYPKERRTCAGFIIVLNEGYINMVVSNHFHSVKNFLFSSAKPRDFDGMLGTDFRCHVHSETPIDKCSFNVTQLKEFF